MSFVIYDLETSGLQPQWNVPLQAALIHTDAALQPLGELSLRCRLPAHIVPAPGALLTTGIRPEQLERAPLSTTEMLGIIAKALEAWAPATIVGYNTLRYDEEILRHGFFTHLMPPYATSWNGHRRADLLIMVQAVAMLEPGAITVPLGATGKPSFKLGEICRANGIALSEDDAHDAMADTRATLALFRHLTTGQRIDDLQGAIFALARAKTNRPAAGSLGKRATHLLDAYISSLPFDLMPNAVIFRTRGSGTTAKGGKPQDPVPYSKNKLGLDFRVVRLAEFGPEETRQLADMRRSGTVEATAGGASAHAISTKMANTLAASARLQQTYNPVNIATVRDVDASRRAGGAKLRKNKSGRKV